MNVFWWLGSGRVRMDIVVRGVVGLVTLGVTTFVGVFVLGVNPSLQLQITFNPASKQ